MVGPSFAKEIFYTARQFDAAEALQPWAWSTASCRPAELESYVKNYADTIAGNAPLTIKAVKFIVGEMMKDESKRDLARCAGMVDACFASKDYHRRPPGLHGEAQAGVHRDVRVRVAERRTLRMRGSWELARPSGSSRSLLG